MTAPRNDVIAAAATLVTTALGAQVEEVVDYRPLPSTLKNKVSVSFHESGKDENVAGGKRYHYDLIIVAGVLHGTTAESLRAAEVQLNNVEDGVINALAGTNNAQWSNAVFVKSWRPPTPPGVKNIRFTSIIIRFKLR